MAIYPSKISVFLFGFAIGIIIAFIATVSKNNKLENLKSGRYLSDVKNKDMGGLERHMPRPNSFNSWLTSAGYIKIPVNFDYFSYSGNKTLNRFLEFQHLKAKANVLCVLFIENVENAYAAVNTWLKRCDSFKLYSKKPVKYLEVTVLRPKSSWQYLCEAIRHIDNNSDNYMWVLFVPDDVYAIPENLRYFVFSENFEEPYYFGHNGFFWNERFNLAQSGFVLSKGSIKALSKKFPSSESCRISGKYWKNGDFYLGKYLSELGVSPIDSRDSLGRERFHLFTPIQLMAPGDAQLFSKYWKSSLHPVIQGKNCCSPWSITFQGTSATNIYFYHYLLYSLHVHEAVHTSRLGNNKSRVFTPSDQVWQQFVLDELGPRANLSAITAKKYYNLWTDKIDSPSIFNKKLRALFFNGSDD